jgi:hypothetical protein
VIDNPNYMPQVLQVIAAPSDGYLILLYFDDGSIHQYDVEPLLDQPVFRPLRDRSLFRRTLTVLNGTAAWDLCGTRDETRCIDLDPRVLYRTTPEIEEPAWVTLDA